MTSDGKFAYNLVPETVRRPCTSVPEETLITGHTDTGMAPATFSREQRFSPLLAAYTHSTAYLAQTETHYQQQSAY
jgi:hypothetical protein